MSLFVRDLTILAHCYVVTFNYWDRISVCPSLCL